MAKKADTPPNNQPQPFPWFDERPIEAEHDKLVSSSKEAQDHLFVVHRAHSLLFCVLQNQSYEDNEQALMAMRLVVRVFNAAGASLKLARSGYFQPAFAMVRDILEVEFLSDLFRRDESALQQWITMDERSRNRQFRPFQVRDALDKLDGFTKKRREAAYKMLSKHAAHVDPQGFNLISPDNFTRIGPFVSEPALMALLQELTPHLQLASAYLVALLRPTHAEVLEEIEVFNRASAKWAAKYRSQPPKVGAF